MLSNSSFPTFSFLLSTFSFLPSSFSETLTVRGICNGQAGVAAMLPPAFTKVQPSTHGAASVAPTTAGDALEQESADRSRL